MVWKWWSGDMKCLTQGKCSNEYVEIQTPTTPTSYSDVRVLAFAFVVLSTALGLTKVVVGSVFFHDCPSESQVPVVVLIAGVSGITNGLLLIHTLIRQKIRCGDCMHIYLIIHAVLYTLESIFVYTTWRLLKKNNDSQNDTKIECNDLFVNIAALLLACGWGLIFLQGVWIFYSVRKDDRERRAQSLKSGNKETQQTEKGGLNL